MNASLSRRSVLAFAAAMAAGSATDAGAQQPSRTLRLVVPFPAGGTADILPRVVAEKVRAAYPAGVVVENRTGAGGNIGAEIVAPRRARRHTLLASPPGPIAINQHLYKSLAFDCAKWVPVTVLATVPNVLAVRNEPAGENGAELIAYLKANPGKVTYASQGNGSTSHLSARCSCSWPASRWSTCPTRARRRRWSTSSPAPSTSSSTTSRRRCGSKGRQGEVPGGGRRAPPQRGARRADLRRVEAARA